MPRLMATPPTVAVAGVAGTIMSVFSMTAAADPLEPVIMPNDDVSFLMYMSKDSGEEQILNGTGPGLARTDTLGTPESVGESFNSPGADILVGWDEIFDSRPGDAGTFSRVRLNARTSDGSPFISQGAAADGYRLMRWEIGDHSDPTFQPMADAFGFRSAVEEILFVNARVVFFNDDVQLNSLEYGFTLGIGSTWDGTDFVPNNLFTVGSDVNRIEITYDYDPTFIPAPASAALLTGMGLFGARRRRR